MYTGQLPGKMLGRCAIGRGRASRVGLLSLWLLAGFAGSVHAASSEEASFREQYARASKLYAEKDYAAAIPALLSAYAITPAPQLLFNIGQAYRRLEKWGTARVYFEMYRALSPTLSTAELSSLDATLVELRDKDEAARRPEVVQTTRTLVIKREAATALAAATGLTTGLVGLSLGIAGGVLLGLDGTCRTPAVAPPCSASRSTAPRPWAVRSSRSVAVCLSPGITFALSLRKPSRPERRPGAPSRCRRRCSCRSCAAILSRPAGNPDGTPIDPAERSACPIRRAVGGQVDARRQSSPSFRGP